MPQKVEFTKWLCECCTMLFDDNLACILHEREAHKTEREESKRCVHSNFSIPQCDLFVCSADESTAKKNGKRERDQVEKHDEVSVL